jgi:hypothetical protein
LRPANWRQQVTAVHASIRQAGLLIDRYQASSVLLDSNTRLELVEQYANLDAIPRWQRLRILAVHKIFKRSRFSNLIFKIIVFSLPLNSVCRN